MLFTLFCVGDNAFPGDKDRALLSLELERTLDEELPSRLPLELRELDRDRDADRDLWFCFPPPCGPLPGGCCCWDEGGDVTVELTALARLDDALLVPLRPAGDDATGTSFSSNVSPTTPAP